MDTILRHKLIPYLAGASFSLSGGSVANASAELAKIPEPMVIEILDDAEGDHWSEGDLIKLIELLSEDPRRQVKERAAALLIWIKSQSYFPSCEHILLKLAQDQDGLVRRATARILATWLAKADGLTQAQFVAEFALSEHVAVRHTLALALCFGLPAFGAEIALEHLIHDQHPAIRAVASRAIRRRIPKTLTRT